MYCIPVFNNNFRTPGSIIHVYYLSLAVIASNSP